MSGFEQDMDDVADAGDVGWQGLLVVVVHLHQCRSLPILDCQEGLAAESIIKVEFCELNPHYLPLTHFNCLCPLEVVWEFVRVVWRS